MDGLGIHFALEPGDFRRVLKAVGDDYALLELILGDFEAFYLESKRQSKWCFQTDSAWDALHRCLTNGRLECESGPYPLAYAVLGGQQLYAGDDYIVSMVTRRHVAATARALQAVTKEWLRERYLAIDPRDYGQRLDDDDFEYTWANFEGLPKFFEDAGRAGRAVIFTAETGRGLDVWDDWW